MFDKFKTISIFIIGLCTLGLSIGVFTCCKSYEPVQIKGQPDACNDYYSTMKYNVLLKNKDGSLPTLVYDECKEIRKELRVQQKQEHCRKLFFGDGFVDKKNYEAYTGYLECLK